MNKMKEEQKREHVDSVIPGHGPDINDARQLLQDIEKPMTFRFKFFGEILLTIIVIGIVLVLHRFLPKIGGTGLEFSAYAIVAVLAYFIGGWIGTRKKANQGKERIR